MDQETGANFLKQVFDIWINPRIEELKKSKKIDDSFQLTRAQVVFSSNGSKPVVRLNSQVRGKAVAIVQGDKIQKIEKFIPEDNRKNKGKGIVTLLKFNDKWVAAFDFRYNKDKCEERIKAADEFYKTAKLAHENGYLRPAFENSFAAAELATKAILGTLSVKLIKKRTHDAVLEALTKWGDLGNIDKRYVDCLKELNKLRLSSRYMTSTAHKKTDINKILNLVSEMIEIARTSIKD